MPEWWSAIIVEKLVFWNLAIHKIVAFFSIEHWQQRPQGHTERKRKRERNWEREGGGRLVNIHSLPANYINRGNQIYPTPINWAEKRFVENHRIKTKPKATAKTTREKKTSKCFSSGMSTKYHERKFKFWYST